MSNPKIKRPKYLLLMAMVLLLAGLFQACSAPAAPAPAADSGAAVAESSGPVVNALGKELPADAAPLDQQVLVYAYAAGNTFTTLDFFEAVYQRADSLTDLLSDALVRVDKNFELHPGAATDWAVDESGLVWTFNLDPNLMWNDGTPVTADDYVATFQYGANPEHAWDFTWYYNGVIKNWTQAVGGEVALDQLGVRAADANTLVIETESQAPYLPAMLIYSAALQKKALETHGALYNSNPETSVSSGPYKLTEWARDQRVVYEINPDYKGTNVPYIEKIISLGIGNDVFMPAYEANEIDFALGRYLSPADIQITLADPDLSAQYHPHPADFRTYYFFFDDTKPPFDDIRVRQAFNLALDRDGLATNVIKEQGIPAYSFLMPGFPAANSAAFKESYPYDLDKARALLAEAGYPGGEGFPQLTLALRNEPAMPASVAQAYASALSAELGIDVSVSNMEFKTYVDALLADPTEVQFSLISYGMDYLDPSNMLGVFASGGRHTWSNPDFDALVTEASSFIGDPTERIQMFQDAEKILVEDVGGIFVYHQTPGDLYKPYLKGAALEPDNNGVAAWHWPGFSAFSTLMQDVYIGNNVTDYRPTPPK